MALRLIIYIEQAAKSHSHKIIFIMKKFLLLLSVIILASCGSSKVVTEDVSGRTKPNDSLHGAGIELTLSEQMALERPETRASGEGLSSRLAQAKIYAEGQARGALARAISSIIKTASEECGLGWEKYAGNGSEGNSVNDEGTKSENKTQQIANELVQNAVVIHQDNFVQPDRRYKVFVCLEYRGDAKSIVNKIKQQIPDEDRMKMEYEFQQFEKKVNEELSKHGK
jgi:hypothetical protein